MEVRKDLKNSPLFEETIFKYKKKLKVHLVIKIKGGKRDE